MAFIAMPWCSLFNPSIQLGLLVEVARGCGARACTRHYNLRFADVLARRAEVEDRRFVASDYMEVGIGHAMEGLGEWIFAVPPFRPVNEGADERYLRELERRNSPTRVLELARWVRAQVPAFLGACVEDLLGSGAQVFGFTTGFNQTLASLSLAQMLKARDPDVFIVFGGADCDGEMGEGLIAAFECVDAVVQGEGEPVLPGLLEDLARYGEGRPQPGLCLRQAGRLRTCRRPSGGRVALDSLPIPDYSEYFASLEGHRLRGEISSAVEITVESSRGCWWGQKHHCTFCGYNGDEMRFRSKSPQRLIGELDELARRTGRLRFLMTDAILDQDFLRTVLPSLATGEADYHIFYETKANLRRDQVELLRKAGVVHIQPGIESLDTAILRAMRKGTTSLLNIRMLKYCIEQGINTLWNIIYGFPGEDFRAYDRMARLVPSLTHLQPPSLVPLVLDRFSPYERDPSSFGLVVDGPPFYYPMVFPDRAVVREHLSQLAYRFEYHHRDRRQPEQYVGPLREAVERWQRCFRAERPALRHELGPGFVNVIDERAGFPRGSYRLDGWRAAAYLACDGGATAGAVARTVAGGDDSGPALSEVEELFAELAELALLYEERGRFLSLSVSARRRRSFVLVEA